MFGYWIILLFLFNGNNRNLGCSNCSWQNNCGCERESNCECRRECESRREVRRERGSECGCDELRNNNCATAFPNPIISRNSDCGCDEEFVQSRGFFTGSTTCGCEAKD